MVPLLAPFLDRMITRDMEKRFTAPQARSFLEMLRSSLSVTQLNSVIPRATPRSAEKYNRWIGLPEDFIREWSSYREAPTPWWVRALRRIW